MEAVAHKGAALSTRIVEAFGEPCAEDLIAIRVWEILRADDKLTLLFGPAIYRRHVLTPPLEGTPLQLVVAPVFQTEHYAPGSLTKGTLRVGVMMLFEQFTRNLEPGEPSILTVLSYIKGLLAEVDPTMNNLTSHQSWAPMEPTPLGVGGKTTAYAVGEVLELRYRSDRFTRKPITN